jgi:hypothetical protein
MTHDQRDGSLRPYSRISRPEPLVLCIVRLEVLTAVVMKVTIFWDIVPYTPYINRRLGGMYHFHLQVRN